MTGAIPPYGKDFRLESLPYDRSHTYASRRYVFKADNRFDVIGAQSDSKRWYVRFNRAPVSTAFKRFQDAMGACQRAYGELFPDTNVVLNLPGMPPVRGVGPVIEAME
jgi:hypothetical protein